MFTFCADSDLTFLPVGSIIRTQKRLTFHLAWIRDRARGSESRIDRHIHSAPQWFVSLWQAEFRSMRDRRNRGNGGDRAIMAFSIYGDRAARSVTTLLYNPSKNAKMQKSRKP